MKKVPDAQKLHGSGIRVDVICGWGGEKIIPFIQEENHTGEIWGSDRNSTALRLVKLSLKRAAVRIAMCVLMRRGLVVVTADKKIEAGELFEATVIRCGGPEGDQHQGHHCLHQRHNR
jgi:hypothetical protein